MSLSLNRSNSQNPATIGLDTYRKPHWIFQFCSFSHWTMSLHPLKSHLLLAKRLALTLFTLSHFFGVFLFDPFALCLEWFLWLVYCRRMPSMCIYWIAELKTLRRKEYVLTFTLICKYFFFFFQIAVYLLLCGALVLWSCWYQFHITNTHDMCHSETFATVAGWCDRKLCKYLKWYDGIRWKCALE